MRALVLVAILLAGCAPGGGRIVDVNNGVVVTAAPPPPADLGPAPQVVPTSAETIVLRPGGELDAAHLEFITALPGYVDGSAKVEAIHPGSDMPLAILTWDTSDMGPGAMSGEPGTCRVIAETGSEPESWGCGSIGDEDERVISSYGHTSEQDGPNMVEIEHGPDAVATVVELADGKVFVVRPGASVVSYHEWQGARPERITVFWADGTRQSEALNHD